MLGVKPGADQLAVGFNRLATGTPSTAVRWRQTNRSARGLLPLFSVRSRWPFRKRVIDHMPIGTRKLWLYPKKICRNNNDCRHAQKARQHQVPNPRTLAPVSVDPFPVGMTNCIVQTANAHYPRSHIDCSSHHSPLLEVKSSRYGCDSDPSAPTTMDVPDGKSQPTKTFF